MHHTELRGLTRCWVFSLPREDCSGMKSSHLDPREDFPCIKSLDPRVPDPMLGFLTPP
jgi:hypothetical protein